MPQLGRYKVPNGLVVARQRLLGTPHGVGADRRQDGEVAYALYVYASPASACRSSTAGGSQAPGSRASCTSSVSFNKAGEKCFVDYAGKKPKIIDPKTGERIEVEFFVAVMAHSA